MLNPREGTISQIRFIYPENVDITAVGYGPFDNGHLLVALSDGGLEVYNPTDLSVISNMQIP